MKRFSIILPVLAAAVLLAGCNKELTEPVEVPEQATVKTILRVGISPDVRTYMSETEDAHRHIYWSDGDEIAVNGISSDPLAEVGENATQAEFSFDGVLSAPYNIVYPASVYTDATHITLPAVQTYKSDGFASGFFPMAAYSAEGSTDVTLKSLCAIIKVSVKRALENPDTDNLVAVRFKGRNGEQVCGSFTLDYQNAALSGNSAAAADKELKVYKTKETSTAEPCVYYLVVPAGTYSNGFDVIVQDVSGHIMTQSKTTSKTLEAGHQYDMAEFEFVPTATEIGIEIGNAAALVQFAQDYNAGEYDDLGDALVATLAADIAFDASTSAAFNAAGGIGKKNNLFGATEDKYFNGCFNGDGHTISGLTARAPLFAAVGSEGVVRNLTMDNTCSFTFTHPDTAELDCGAAVGYLKGLLSEVMVEANVTMNEADELSNASCIGGLVGRETVGTIIGCVYDGTITVPAEFQSAASKIMIGGIVGRISNADGVVKDCDFKGIIDNEGQMIAAEESDEMKNNPQLMIGGIAGLNSGTISGCYVWENETGLTVVLNDGSDHPYSGTIVNHTINAYHYAVGGVAGRNDGTVSGCENYAPITNLFSADRGDSGNLNGRYLLIGGIVGYNAATCTVTGCTNNAAIIDRANPKVHYVGGVVARNKGTVSSCSNSGTIGVGTSHSTPYGARLPSIGGVIGANDGGASVSDIQNTGAINVSRIENTTGIICNIGGVIGKNAADIVGNGTITNSGNVAQSSGIGMVSTPAEANDYGLFVGGVIGYSTKAVSGVSNSGNVTYTCSATGIGAQYVYVGGVIGKVKAADPVDIDHCTNTGNVTFTAKASHKANAATRYYFNYLGGIVGYACNANIFGDASNKCTNSGTIKGGDGGDNNNQPSPSFAIGGIVGYITGDSSVSYCAHIGGQAYNDHWSNRGIGSYDCPSVGGIVGQILGAEGELIPVSNCSVAAEASVNARRGAAGGIVGLAQYAELSDCTMPVDFETSQSGYFYGGIIAAAQNSNISDCTFSGSTIKSSQIQIGGGIIGKLDTGSVVDGCSSYATTINKNGAAIAPVGGVAGQSVAGATIKDCHYKAAIAVCGDANFTDGGGNTADL